MQKMRRNMESAWIVAASDRIQDAILALPAFQAAKSVGGYLALPYEVQIRRILEACWSGDKRVAVPAWNEDKNRYELTWIEAGDWTHAGRWNISEPDSMRRAGLMDLDLLLVPALAYDHSGGRLGHGGGHYDRILGSWSGFKVGVAFDFQVFDKVPMGAQDIPVDMVITERGIFRPDQTAPSAARISTHEEE